jgi:hypothetical protein
MAADRMRQQRRVVVLEIVCPSRYDLELGAGDVRLQEFADRRRRQGIGVAEDEERRSLELA